MVRTIASESLAPAFFLYFFWFFLQAIADNNTIRPILVYRVFWDFHERAGVVAAVGQYGVWCRLEGGVNAVFDYL